MARRKRAALALWSLAIAGFFGADLIGYGSDEGYKVESAAMLIGGLVLFAAALFAINVATYKRR
jgi:sugar phosphate permease